MRLCIAFDRKCHNDLCHLLLCVGQPDKEESS